ncbi:hypothetical protein VTG60DRAFT_4831 [Thermothelomyces hinnuleus]
MDPRSTDVGIAAAGPTTQLSLRGAQGDLFSLIAPRTRRCCFRGQPDPPSEGSIFTSNPSPTNSEILVNNLE